MYKKNKFLSLVVITLLLANNSSGVIRVVAEEFAKDNRTSEKADSNPEEITPPSSSKSEQTKEYIDERKEEVEESTKESFEKQRETETTSENNGEKENLDIEENLKTKKKIRDWFLDEELAKIIAEVLATEPSNLNDYPYIPDATTDTLIDEAVLEGIKRVDKKLSVVKVKSLKGMNQLKNLEKLVLVNHKQTDITDWDSLNQLSKLQYLWLDNVAITNEQVSLFLPELSQLSLNTFEAWGDMIFLDAPIKSLDFLENIDSSTLKIINLIEVGVEDITSLSKVTNPIAISLLNNQIVDISSLAKIDDLLHSDINISDQLVEKKEKVIFKDTEKDYRISNPIKSTPNINIKLSNISNGGKFDENTNEIVWEKDKITSTEGFLSFSWDSSNFQFNGNYSVPYQILNDMSTIQTKDTIIYQGQNWQPEQNFVYAKDEEGNSVSFSDDRIDLNSASVNNEKIGINNLIYSFKGKYKKTDSPFIVTVKEDKTRLELKDVQLNEGQNFDPNLPFKNVLDKDGNEINAKDIKEYYIDNKLSNTLDTSKPGVHKVYIKYLNAAGQTATSNEVIVSVNPLWGTSPWYMTEDGTLVIQKGEIGEYDKAPWNRSDSARVSNESITKIVLKGEIIAPENSQMLFSAHPAEPNYLNNLEEIEGLGNLDTSKVKTMNSMFYNATNLKKLDLHNFNTSKVIDMAQLFAGLKNIEELNLSRFNTSNVISMQGMFACIWKIERLDLSSFDTSKVTKMQDMFYDAKSLRDINLSSFDTSKVTNMYQMFNGAKNLENLDLNTFDTLHAPDMTFMLSGVVGLKSLKLGDNFKFNEKASLEVPIPTNNDDETTGRWIKSGGQSKGYTPVEFMKYYGSVHDLTPGTYVAQVSCFGFKEVPEKMSFKDTKISNRTTLTQRQDPEWKMTVEDTRPTSSNWHVTAKMEEGFKDSKGNLLDSDLLLFRKNGQDDQWINSTSETMVYEGKGSPVRDDHEISWGEKEGPLIQAAPGAVKAEEYKGEITWNLVDAPL